MERGFALLPDVNDDGYDDFGIYYRDRFIIPEEELVYYWDGIYLFFGGEDVDGEPDRILAGAQRGEASTGELVGGDFNGDGVGDIAVRYGTNSPQQFEELHYHFGSAHLDTLPDLVFSGYDLDERYEYLYSPIGAVGDYNGDGADDIVVSTTSDIRLIILAGNPGWRVGVEDETPPQDFKLTMTVSPNPFNSTTTIRYTAPSLGDCELTILDISGREIVRAAVPAGDGMYPWTAPESGVYIVRLASGSQQTTRKLVCVK